MTCQRLALVILGSAVIACASGKKWVKRPLLSDNHHHGVRLFEEDGQSSQKAQDPNAAQSKRPSSDQSQELSANEWADAKGSRPELRLKGTRSHKVKEPMDGRLLGIFRNTYYDFPAESAFSGDTIELMAPSCKAIARVRRDFFEALCVQGSGTLMSGQTVSFSKRDCSCAETCPRTGQKICFDALNHKEFPWGRGAQGSAIVPLRTVAVDSNVIPLGTKLYIPEFDGIPRSNGGVRHDGCFVAEDRGMKVVGEHIDIFSGNPSTTEHLNGLVPSNEGVHVYLGTARCQ